LASVFILSLLAAKSIVGPSQVEESPGDHDAYYRRDKREIENSVHSNILSVPLHTSIHNS
jgi:hypothetical protein